MVAGEGEQGVPIGLHPSTVLASSPAAAVARVASHSLPVSPSFVTLAVPVEDVGPRGGLDPRAGLGHLPARELSEDEAGRVRHGGSIAGAPLGAEAVALLREGRLLAIGVPDASGGLRPSVVLEDPR